MDDCSSSTIIQPTKRSSFSFSSDNKWKLITFLLPVSSFYLKSLTPCAFATRHQRNQCLSLVFTMDVIFRATYLSHLQIQKRSIWFFCITSLPLPSTRWVLSTIKQLYHSLSTHTKQCTAFDKPLQNQEIWISQKKNIVALKLKRVEKQAWRYKDRQCWHCSEYGHLIYWCPVVDDWLLN